MDTESLATKFSDYLQDKELRMTTERRDILEHIFAEYTHFEAEDLHIRIRQAGHRVARATIYRTLALLVEADILREVAAHPGEVSTHYELVHGLTQRHEHLTCEHCGQTFEVTDPEIVNRLRQSAADMGYELTDYTVRLVGKCNEVSRTGTCARSDRTQPTAILTDPK
jgi:Fur family transcriptional regulator, ferric uptake regulator